MKKLVLAAFLLSASLAGKSQTPPADISKVVTISNENYDFGKIVPGKPVEYTLEVKNISKDSVAIENVQVGCGCTTPKYVKGQKIAPGATGTVVLGFNGSASGNFEKTATLFFTGGLNKLVRFHGVAAQ